jgi:hypothetical protein
MLFGLGRTSCYVGQLLSLVVLLHVLIFIFSIFSTYLFTEVYLVFWKSKHSATKQPYIFFVCRRAIDFEGMHVTFDILVQRRVEVKLPTIGFRHFLFSSSILNMYLSRSCCLK